MSYTKTMTTMIGLLIGLTISGVYESSLDANTDDMSPREVEALLHDRMEGLSNAQLHGLTMHIFRLCKHYHFTVSSVLSVIATESRFDQNALSSVGAIGLMQILPTTAGYIAKREKILFYRSARDLYDPRTNLTVGVAYLSHLRDRFVQSHRYLAAYNMGPAKYSRLVKNNLAKPDSVRKYVMNIQDGVYQIRQEAGALALNN